MEIERNGEKKREEGKKGGRKKRGERETGRSMTEPGRKIGVVAGDRRTDGGKERRGAGRRGRSRDEKPRLFWPDLAASATMQLPRGSRGVRWLERKADRWRTGRFAGRR